MVLAGIGCFVLEDTNKQTVRHIKTNGFINLQFLQELSRQKPFWDEVTLSSLVKKRFVTATASADTAITAHIFMFLLNVIHYSFINFTSNLQGLQALFMRPYLFLKTEIKP